MISLESLKEQFPNVAFNDDHRKRNKNCTLVQLDPYHKNKNNYDIKILRQYKNVLTWNSQIFIQMKKMGAPVAKLHSYPIFDRYTTLDKFVDVSDKRGVCLVGTDFNTTDLPFDITTKSLDLLLDMKRVKTYVYADHPIGENSYVRPVVGTEDKLKAINLHSFCICFEDVYHPLWSLDYVTSQIINCLKAKTIPIYYGCFNIDSLIPSDYFIDYRDFKNSKELEEYLIEFDMSRYEMIVNSAYAWAMTSRLGDPTLFTQALIKYIGVK